MPHVIPQVALHRVIQDGVKILKQNPDVLDDVFQYYNCPEMINDYGQTYIDNIKTWFVETKIPVVQAWSINPQKVPQIGIKLATEQEDESTAVMGDVFGIGEDSEIGMSPSIVQLDIVVMSSRNGDEALWLYYILTYILLKQKRKAEALGLEKHTWSASDYNRNANKLADNIWERYIRFRALVQNYWEDRDVLCFDDVNTDITVEGDPSGEQVKV